MKQATKNVIAITLLILPISCFSMVKISCYSQGRLIYSGSGDEFAFDGEMVILRNHKDKNDIIVKGDCLIVTDLLR